MNYSSLIDRIESYTNSGEGFVYFISTPGHDNLKIGYSSTPVFRLQNLKIEHSAPLELLGFIHGNRYLERILHNHFEEYRVEDDSNLKGTEWFRFTDNLKLFIEEFLIKTSLMTTDFGPPEKVQVDGFVPVELAEEFENLAFKKYGPKHGYRGKALADALADWINKIKSEK